MSRFRVAGGAAILALTLSCGLDAAEPANAVVETAAAAALGQGQGAILSLVRELTEWKQRAVNAEERLGIASGEFPTSQAGQSSGTVMGALDSERVLIVSLGRLNGASQGALVSVGSGLVAKIVEARESVSAALVENSYKGSLVKLEGLPVRLSVRF